VTEVTIRNRYKEMVEALNIKDKIEELVSEDEEAAPAAKGRKQGK
jgi:hypothetical protein